MANQVEAKGPSSLEFDDSDIEKVFTDVVQVSANQETVILDIATRNKDNKTADVSHRLYFTLPHFKRFLEVSTKTLNQVEKKLKELKDQEEAKVSKKEDASK